MTKLYLELTHVCNGSLMKDGNTSYLSDQLNSTLVKTLVDLPIVLILLAVFNSWQIF